MNVRILLKISLKVLHARSNCLKKKSENGERTTQIKLWEISNYRQGKNNEDELKRKFSLTNKFSNRDNSSQIKQIENLHIL